MEDTCWCQWEAGHLMSSIKIIVKYLRQWFNLWSIYIRRDKISYSPLTFGGCNVVDVQKASERYKTCDPLTRCRVLGWFGYFLFFFFYANKLFPRFQSKCLSSDESLIRWRKSLLNKQFGSICFAVIYNSNVVSQWVYCWNDRYSCRESFICCEQHSV